LISIGLSGCRTPGKHRRQTDARVERIIEQKQAEALGHSEAFTINRPWESMRRELTFTQDLPYAGPESLGVAHLERIKHWPRDDYAKLPEDAESSGSTLPEGAEDILRLTLTDVLRVSAANSREYQTRKETVYNSALDLDVERDRYESTFSGIFKGTLEHDRTGSGTPTGVLTRGLGESTLGITKRFLNGIVFASSVGLNVAKSLSPTHTNSKSIFGDASVTIPLMRGWGRHVAGEPLTQAERDAIYAILEFERFKRTFAVSVASEYLAVLRQIDQVINAEENYRGLIASARRARRLADAGLLSEVQVDQAKQNELSSRNGWISARERLDRSTDAFKSTIGLPTDARIELDRDDLISLADSVRDVIALPEADDDEVVPPADAPVILREPTLEGAGRYEISSEHAVVLAIENRLDLRIAQDRVRDAQRALVVAADALRAEVTLMGTADVGEHRSKSDGAMEDSDDPTFDEGVYGGMLTIDLPLERTREQSAYRKAWITLEQRVREVQELEDRIKLEVRNKLRDLLEARETLQIQGQATKLADRRVRSSTLFLEAGRVQIRDLLEAQESLLGAQNALTTAMVSYRVAELELQRDLGLLSVNSDGLWKEFKPEEHDDE